MSEILDQLLIILTGLGTVASAAAIVYWVIKPIRRYHGIRSRIIEDCVFYAQVIDPAGLDDRLLTRYERRVESNRRNSAALSACLLELPEWYLASLRQRGHTPGGVPAELIGLSHTTDEDVARKKMNRIKNCLGLKTEDDPNNSRAHSVAKKILTLVVMLGLDVDPEKAAALYDERSKKFVAGQEYLKHQKYKEARTAFEAGLQDNPADVMAHFYLGETCQRLKAWACAEAHYETSLRLNAQILGGGFGKTTGAQGQGLALAGRRNAGPQRAAHPAREARPGRGHRGQGEQAGSRRGATRCLPTVARENSAEA